MRARPQENFFLSISPQRVRSMSQRLQSLHQRFQVPVLDELHDVLGQSFHARRWRASSPAGTRRLSSSNRPRSAAAWQATQSLSVARRASRVVDPWWQPPQSGYRHLDQVADWNLAVMAAVGEALQFGELPIMLGGDHCLAIGSITAVARHCREHGTVDGAPLGKDGAVPPRPRHRDPSPGTS